MDEHALLDLFVPRLEARLAASPELAKLVVGIRVELAQDDAEPQVYSLDLDRAQVRWRGGAGPAQFGVLMHREDFRDLLEGAARVDACLIDGRLEVEGDVALAHKLLPVLLGD